MKRIFWLIAILLLLCPQLFAATRYVSPNGSNTAPYDTWAKAITNPNTLNGLMVAGDTALFGAGDYYNVRINVPTGGTSPTDRTVYACSSMTVAASRRANIYGGEIVTANWIPHDTIGAEWIWKKAYTPVTSARNSWYDRTDIITTVVQSGQLLRPRRVLNNGDVCIYGSFYAPDGGVFVETYGDWYYNAITDTLYMWPLTRTNPNSTTVMASLQEVFSARAETNDYITIYGLNVLLGNGVIVMGTSDGGGGDNWVVEECNLKWASNFKASNPALVFHGNTYGSQISSWSQFNSFKNCSLFYVRGDSPDVHGGSGMAFYATRETVIDGCYFDSTVTAAGVSFKMGRYNDYGIQAVGNVVKNSFFTGKSENGVWLGEKSEACSVYTCTFDKMLASSVTIAGGDDNSPYGYVQGNNFVCNNTVSRSLNLFQAFYAINGSNNKIKYNLFYDQVIVGNPYTWWSSIRNHLGVNNSQFFVVDSNMYWDPTASFLGYCNGTDNRTWAQWQACGFDVHGVIADPLLTNPAQRDFSRPTAAPQMNQTYGGQKFTLFGAWQPPARYPNPLNTWLDPNSTIDDRTIYLPGMDAANPPDGDTIALKAKYKIMIWSAGGAGATRYGAYEAARLKRASPNTKLILYTSLDHGLHSLSVPVDTTDPGNGWNLDDEYSHYRLVCQDSGKSYYSLFYQFAEQTEIQLSPVTANGFIYTDIVVFPAYTAPVSDDDSSSVVPDFYCSPNFVDYGTLVLTDSVMIGGSINRRYNYKGTPIGGKVTRVLPDFSNPLARWAEMKYALRAMSQNLANLGGTGNDVYGWGPVSDSGFYWDGLFLDNSGDHQLEPPEGSTLISGGNILSSRGVIGNWYADTTKAKMRKFHKEYFTQLTNYMNNAANFWNNQPRATAANFGTWTSWMSNSPYREWYGADNGINLKCLEYASADKSYNLEAYETVGNGRSTAELIVLDSLARANDFYVAFSGRTNAVDTTVASGWGAIWQGFLRSNWVRYQTFLGERGLFAMQPVLFLSNGYLPCSGGSGTSYQGLNYSPLCNDRAEVDSFFNLTTLPFMTDYDLGYRVPDSARQTMAMTDASGAAVTVYRSFFRKVVGSDTTDTWTYYFPRKLSSWEWRRSGNHKVVITPPNNRAKRLEYSGNLTTISGAAQDCWIGDQLILSYTHSATIPPTHATPANGAANQSASVTLDWSSIANASGYQYQVDDNSDFSSVFYSATVAPSTGGVSGLAGSKTYYWRVRAVNATDSSAWTSAWTFTTVAANTWDLAYVVDSDTVYANLTYNQQFIDYYNLVRHYVVHVITDDSARAITSPDAFDGYFISETVSLTVGQNFNNLRPTTKGVLIADRGMSDDFDVATAAVGPFLLGEAGTGVQTLQAVNTSNWITAQMSPRIYFDFNVNYGCFPFTGIPASAKVLFNSTLRNWDGVAGYPTDTSYCFIIDAGGALATSGTAAGRRAVGLCFYPFFTNVSSLIQGGYCFPLELLGNMSAWVFSDEANPVDGGYNCYSHEQYEVNQGWDEFGLNYLAAFYGGRIGWDFRVGIMMFRLWNMEKKILPGWAPDSLVLTIPLAVGAFGIDTPPAGDSYDGFDLWVKAYEVISPTQWHMPMSHTGVAGKPFETADTPPVPRDSTWTNRQNAVGSLTSPTPWAAIDLLAGTDHELAAFDSVRINSTTFPNDGNQRFRFVISGARLRKPGFNWIVVKSFDMTGGLNTADIEFAPNFFNSARGIYAQRAELYLSPVQTAPLLIKKKKNIDE